MHYLHSFRSPLPSSLTVEDLILNYKEQVELEKRNYVKIKTIEKRDDLTENLDAYVR